MQRQQLSPTRELIVLEIEDVFEIPNNCYAFVEHEDKRLELLTTKTVKGSQLSKLILASKIRGG